VDRPRQDQGLPALIHRREGGRTPIHLSGSATNSEIRIHRGGIAILSAMFSRAYFQDVRRAHKSSGAPTTDDPTRGHQS
jgi:hypothetical protein